jgi:hypothetical protein
MPAGQYALTEPIVYALLARLQDPAKLNLEIANIAEGVVNQSESNSLVSVPPAQIFDFVPPPSYLTAFPTIGIQDTATLGEDDTGVSLTGRHSMGVVVFCSDPDQHILAWQLRRYLQAITRVVLAGRTLGAEDPLAAWGVGFERISWGPTLESVATPQTWMSFAMLQIWCRREELP